QTYATIPSARKANSEKTPNPMLQNYRTVPLILAILALAGALGKLSTLVHNHLWEHHGWIGGMSVVSVIGGFLALPDRFLWRFAAVKLLVNVPVVRGEDEGRVGYNYQGADPAKRARVDSRQRATHVSVCCWFTAEGEGPQEDTRSRSIHADLLDRDGH